MSQIAFQGGFAIGAAKDSAHKVKNSVSAQVDQSPAFEIGPPKVDFLFGGELTCPITIQEHKLISPGIQPPGILDSVPINVFPTSGNNIIPLFVLKRYG